MIQRQSKTTERRLPCRDGPRLATYNSTLIDRLTRRIETDTFSSSTAQFVRPGFAKTAAREIAARREGSCESASDGYSAESTPTQAAPLRLSTHERSPRPLAQDAGFSPGVEHGMIVIKTIACLKRNAPKRIRSNMRSLAWASPNGFCETTSKIERPRRDLWSAK